MSEANKRQVGGDHYKKAGATGEEHWDRVVRLEMDYLRACATKYIERCWDKYGIEDLEKAGHYIQKAIEVAKAQDRKGKMEFRKLVDSFAGLDPFSTLPMQPHDGAYRYVPGEPLPEARFRHESTFGVGNGSGLLRRVHPAFAGDTVHGVRKLMLSFTTTDDKVDNTTRYTVVVDGTRYVDCPVVSLLRNEYDSHDRSVHVTVEVSAGRKMPEPLWEPHSTYQFTFEGAHGGMTDDYTCNKCHKHFTVPAHMHPAHGHTCITTPTETANGADVKFDAALDALDKALVPERAGVAEARGDTPISTTHAMPDDVVQGTRVTQRQADEAEGRGYVDQDPLIEPQARYPYNGALGTQNDTQGV